MGKIVAIDYGLKRIGLAISDANHRIALPWITVEGGRLELENICKILLPRKGEIEKIIIGLPLHMSGQKSEMSQKVEVFAQKLGEKIGLPVLLVDERLSSRHADTSLRETKVSRKKRTEILDQTAAALLLQSYLDQRNV